MSKKSACPKADYNPEIPAFDELSHEVYGNAISVRVNKTVGRIKTEGKEWPDTSAKVHATCSDSQGNKCPVGCVKLNVQPNKAPPPKKPDEETFLVHATRQIINAEEMKNSLEIELRTPRNYRPLADIRCPPPEPNCVPVEPNEASKKRKKKGK